MVAQFKAFSQNQGFIKYFKNTSWLLTEKILRLFVGLFVGIWVARYLGPEQFGLFSYVQSFVGLFTTIATLGLDGIVVRELVKNENRRDEILGTAFYLKLFGALMVLILLAVTISFMSNDHYTNIFIFIVASATLFQSFNVIDFYFQSKVLSRYVVFANIISLFISSLVKITLILYEAPLIAFVWTVLFDSIVLALGFIYFYSKNLAFKFQLFKFNKLTAINLLQDSWPLVLSSIVITIYMKIDQIMIMNMLDAQSVGQYAAAVRISEAWYFIPMAVSSSLFPAIINAKKQSEELYYSRLEKLYNLMVWVAISVALPMTFLSDWVVHLLYGNQYSQSGNVLMIHIWAGLFAGMGAVTSSIVIVNNKQKNGIIATVSGAIINIVLNFLMIPYYGIQGAAIATMISQIVSGFIVPMFFKIDDRYPWIAIKSLIFLGVKK
jgi:O-antigen/teichoic acid export membrane protein